jgi:hypothetical protein
MIHQKFAHCQHSFFSRAGCKDTKCRGVNGNWREHFVAEGSSSLEHMNKRLETCTKNAFRPYSSAYKYSSILVPPIVAFEYYGRSQ